MRKLKAEEKRELACLFREAAWHLEQAYLLSLTITFNAPMQRTLRSLSEKASKLKRFLED